MKRRKTHPSPMHHRVPDDRALTGGLSCSRGPWQASSQVQQQVAVLPVVALERAVTLVLTGACLAWPAEGVVVAAVAAAAAVVVVEAAADAAASTT